MLMPSNSERAQFAGNRLRIVIAGAGVSGILMGIRLRKRGMTNFRIFEKAAALGGTWRDNIYPGVACDTPSHAYSYSFAVNTRYTKRYATGPEILKYYGRMARKFEIERNITYNSEVTSAVWTGAAWRIRINDGEEIEAEVFISACGRLHHPVIPDLPGLGDFAGPCFHSARWDQDVELAGKRFGLIGTGSSATQLVTALPDKVGKLVVFQRSPHWFITPPNARLGLFHRLKMALIPGAATRAYWDARAFSTKMAYERVTPEGRKALAQICLDALGQIRDPELRRKLTPDYGVGCKRMVMCEGYPTGIQKPNVELEVEPIERIVADGIVMKDGRFHPLDILCLATGFKSDAFMRPMTVTGLNGMTLDDLWAENFINYRTVALPYMPNFFMINGPFSPGGTTTIVFSAEIQSNYVAQLVDRLAEAGGYLVPSEARTRELFAAMQERGKNSIWSTGGCDSWYLDKNGVPIVDPIMPDEMAIIMKHAHFEDFIHEPCLDTELVALGRRG